MTMNLSMHKAYKFVLPILLVFPALGAYTFGLLNIPVLNFLLVLPIVGAIVLTFMGEEGDDAKDRIRFVAIWSSGATFLISLVVVENFDFNTRGMQLQEIYSIWLRHDLIFHLGVDGLSLVFILLTSILTPLCIMACWKAKHGQLRLLMICILLIEGCLMGVFTSLNLLVFYIFFEAVLIPMFLLIGVWGGEHRKYAAYKFFLYTFLGSILMFLSILYILDQAKSLTLPILFNSTRFPLEVQKYLWLGFFASFAVKLPMWPFHTWLPDAHVEAPTIGSMFLAGILLKLAGYGFLRTSLPLFPDASLYFAPFVQWLSVIAIVYTSIVALGQKDIKKLIAYASVAHMGYVTLGLFTFMGDGITGSIYQMLSHGFISAALFFCVGVLYERTGSKKIEYFQGVLKVMPRFGAYFLFFSLASIGFPGLSGFIGEFLVIFSAYSVNGFLAAGASLGVVLGAAYMLWLYGRTMMGPLKKGLETLHDLDRREQVVMGIFGILILLLGVYPKVILEFIDMPVMDILKQYEIEGF